MRTVKTILPWWLPDAALADESLLAGFEHVTRPECLRRAQAGLIAPADPSGRFWRTVPRARTDDSTACLSSLISTELSKSFRETIVSQIKRRPMHEIEEIPA